MSEDKARYTQGGTNWGYEPQYRKNEGDEWSRVPTCWRHPREAQTILSARGDRVPALLGLCTYEQAWALAWTFSAEVASHGGNIFVRVLSYRIDYDAKAFEDDAFYC